MPQIAKKLAIGLVAAAGFAMPAMTPAAAEGDAAAGEKVFKRCTACHKIGEGAKNSVGPQLNGVVGRAAGSVEGYKYGAGIIDARDSKQLVWDDETLFAYLADPKGYIREFTGNSKAKVKMVFKLKKEEDRKNVIAYMKTIPAQ